MHGIAELLDKYELQCMHLLVFLRKGTIVREGTIVRKVRSWRLRMRCQDKLTEKGGKDNETLTNHQKKTDK